MEGLKAIAQSTFDKLQQFRPSGNTTTNNPGGSHSHNPGGPNHTGGNPGDGGDSGPYRYNVIEIGAFGPAPSSLVSSPGLRRQQSSSTPNLATNGGASRQSVNGGGGGGSTTSASGAGSSSTTVRRVTMNEWMVFEDDLAAFMKKRPVDYATVATEPQENNANASNTARKGSSKSQASTRKEEVEAFASLKLVCIQRIDPNDENEDEEEEDDDDVEEEYYLDNDNEGEDDYRRHLKDYQRQNQPPCLQPETNTLAISRDTFLRLYVTLMDGDHSALYYLAREYDGFHEFNDTNKGITTKYVGTADYALLWTFNRRTLEARGLFIDRCQRWQAKDSFPILTAAMSGAPEPSRLSMLSSDGLILPRSAAQGKSPTAAQHPGSPPVTPVTPNNNRSTSRQLYTHLEHNHNPSHASRLHDASSVHSTPSRRWTKNRTGSVTASEAWRGFRETLSIYRSYVFVPQLLSFVGVVHMLRTFDDQLNDEDLPLIKSVEATLVGNVQRNSSIGGRNRRGMRQSSRSVAGFDPASSSFYAGSPSASRYGRGGLGGEDGRHGNANLHAASSRISSIMMPSQTTNFSLVSEQNNNQAKNPFAPSTPPAETADKPDQDPQATSGPSRPGTATGPPTGQTPQQAAQAAQIAQAQAHAAAQATAQAQAAAITALAARDKLLAQAVLLSRVDTSLANKRRHLDLARKLLEVLRHEHETLFVDVVAPLYLDRYHRAMEGLVEAIPALERHIASLDDFLHYLKGRAETLSGLVRTSSDCNCCCFANLSPLMPFELSRDHHQQLSSILQHPAFPAPVILHPPLRRKRKKSSKAKPTHNHHHSPEPPSSPSLSLSRTLSDAWSLRCNESDSRSSDLDLRRRHNRPPYAAPVAAGEVFTTAGGRTASPVGFGGSGFGFGSSAIRGWSRGRQPFTSAAASLAAIVAGDAASFASAAPAGTVQTGPGGPALGGRRAQSTSGGEQQPQQQQQSNDQRGQGQGQGQQQQQQQDTDQRPQSARQRRGSNIGFYAGYLFRGNNSHRVAQ